ncbi:MAG: hypothetical protein UW24_C0014G0012 [Parcubacteria group bacterium GW2011_GWA2_44_12]|nr:MAG: hypothetical protein UW24_C0014G0012 [Parcubacteria group bacterium GW2011_GWA2_44_12]
MKEDESGASFFIRREFPVKVITYFYVFAEAYENVLFQIFPERSSRAGRFCIRKANQ